jgi:ferritin-like metal-binding protein YciE
MKLFGKEESDRSKPHHGLLKLFENELKDIYWVEKTLEKEIPKMIEKATSEDLRNALQEHLDVTIVQAERLEKVFGILGSEVRGKKCEAMVGILKEGRDVIESMDEESTCDAGIILAAQKVEHYEIATYGTLCEFAKLLDMDDAAELFAATLEEEKQADATLTEVAESSVNIEALAETD